MPLFLGVLIASDAQIVPLQAEDYGAQGIMDVQDSVGMVTSGPNPNLRLLGYLITMFNSRKTIHQMYAKQLRELYGDDVFAAAIPHAADYPEAIAYRKPVAMYKPRSAAAKAIKALAEELESACWCTVQRKRRPPEMGKLEDMMRGAGANVGESMGAGRQGSAVHRATAPAFGGRAGCKVLQGAHQPRSPVDRSDHP